MSVVLAPLLLRSKRRHSYKLLYKALKVAKLIIRYLLWVHLRLQMIDMGQPLFAKVSTAGSDEIRRDHSEMI